MRVIAKLRAYAAKHARHSEAIHSEATSVCGLVQLVYETLSYLCVGGQSQMIEEGMKP